MVKVSHRVRAHRKCLEQAKMLKQWALKGDVVKSTKVQMFFFSSGVLTYPSQRHSLGSKHQQQFITIIVHRHSKTIMKFKTRVVYQKFIMTSADYATQSLPHFKELLI